MVGRSIVNGKKYVKLKLIPGYLFVCLFAFDCEIRGIWRWSCANNNNYIFRSMMIVILMLLLILLLMNMNNKALCLEILTIPGFFETLNTEISSYIFLIYIHSSSACNYTVLNKE